jgi:plasmid maintenance system antidote protein VapI
MSKKAKNQITPEMLANIKKGTQNLIEDYLKRNPDETQSGFATKIGIHPAQMLLFMRNERGLTDKSLGRIGKFLTEN